MYRIHALSNGRCVIAGNHAFLGGDPEERHPYQLFLWLVEGGPYPILVDAGLRRVDEMNQGAAHVLAEPITQLPGETAAAQLAVKGVRPEDVGAVFITHLHFDHVDELGLYPNARLIVSGRGLAAATAFPGWQGSWAPHKTLQGLAHDWRDRVSATDDAEILPGIRTMWLGGHTPCSQAVIVTTSLGRTALTGDTVSLMANLERDIPVGVASDYDQCRAAIAQLRTHADILLPSHDPGVLERHPSGVIGG
ncbi:MAG TPA: N-acyl homoserine lactonase family protein [Armatimonadota bacterium]|jgi:glyoxylase-like metal-dependent hydrolase (beta-lactamase superfamily II)